MCYQEWVIKKKKKQLTACVPAGLLPLFTCTSAGIRITALAGCNSLFATNANSRKHHIGHERQSTANHSCDTPIPRGTGKRGQACQGLTLHTGSNLWAGICPSLLAVEIKSVVYQQHPSLCTDLFTA